MTLQNRPGITTVFSLGITLAALTAFFLAVTLPLAFERPTGGRSAERQAYTAGIIRNYCLEPTLSVFQTPQIHFGKSSFNLELPLFEKVQGLIARVAGDALNQERCDAAVEVTGKVTSILFSAIGLLVVALLGTVAFGGPFAGIFAAVVLGTDELWLRYSTYTMIENRVLVLGVLAILLSIKRRGVSSGILWGLVFVQKPQIFVFCAAFWLMVELMKEPGLRQMRLRAALAIGAGNESLRRVTWGFLGACVAGLAWHGANAVLNPALDLPWIIHTGPRSTKWYFGNWNDRFSWEFYRGLFLGWFKDSGVNVGLPALLILNWLKRRDYRMAELFKRTLPFLAARFIYLFLFYSVVTAHEYYALPFNVARALTLGGVLALIFDIAAQMPVERPRRFRNAELVLGAGLIVLVLLRSAALGVRDYSRFALNINNPESAFYHTEWDRQVFPEVNSFVVMALPAPATGRDLLYLYLTKQRGFLWCARNEAFAPRAFWKAQGVRYVAWATGIDPETRHINWIVRPIDEELQLARARNWSSDLRDAWAGQSMAEWAALASRTGKDPCLDERDFNPQTWGKVGE